jgi:hypothetical protein
VTKQKDQLQIYFGENLKIGKIEIRQPTLGEIIEIGEQEYFTLIHTIIATPSDHKAKLWDAGIVWEEIDDIVFFSMLTQTLPVDATKVLFGELDFTKLSLVKKEDGEFALVNQEQGIILDKYAYLHICDFICRSHNTKQKRERAGNSFTRQMMIKLNREEIARSQKKDFESTLQPLISSMVNHSGFKYDLSEVRNLTFYQFMDSVQRISLISSATLYSQGIYAGTIDKKKIDNKALNWLRKIEPKK